MPYAKLHLYFLFFLLAAAFLVVFLVVKPFFGPLILAMVFAFLFQPLYKKLLSFLRARESLAALATTIIAVILIVMPVIFLGFQIFKESSQLYYAIANGDGNGFIALIENALTRAGDILPIPESFEINFSQYLRQGLDAIAHNLGSIFASVTKFTLHLFVFLIAFYFLLKDGYKLKDYFVELSPLADNDDEFIVSRLKLAVSSVVKGSLSIGLIQGMLTGIGFALFGVPNAVIWGSVAAITSLIPSIGTALVIIPAIIFLFFSGDTISGIGLLVWGLTAVGLIDNLLGPKLVGRGMRLHPLAVFVAVLGGLAFFGPLGFLLGPLSVSLCLALVEIYFSMKPEEKDFNRPE
ncbi:MAG: AI-2E family transporter [Patescibacteria group bacterium]